MRDGVPGSVLVSAWGSLRGGLRGSVWLSAREALLDTLALVLPTDCAGCGSEGRELCAACRGRLASALVRAASPDGIQVYAGASYDELVRRVVLACKQGRTGLANPLAGLLAVALEAALAEAGVAGPHVELCAVPSTRAAYRRRGFDPARLVLARTGQTDARVLRPARPHHVQKGLGRDARRTNLRGVHRARGRLDGRTFLLVDDVVTTGATIDEAARAIREAGGEVLAAVAIAGTPLRGGFRHARTTPSESAG